MAREHYVSRVKRGSNLKCYIILIIMPAKKMDGAMPKMSKATMKKMAESLKMKAKTETSPTKKNQLMGMARGLMRKVNGM